MRRLYLRNAWREGLIVNLLKKGDKEEPGNYRGITLLSVVGKVFCKILNNRLVEHLDRERALHEGQAGFRKNKSCIDNVYTLNEVVQGRLREDKPTYTLFFTRSKDAGAFGKKSSSSLVFQYLYNIKVHLTIYLAHFT